MMMSHLAHMLIVQNIQTTMTQSHITLNSCCNSCLPSSVCPLLALHHNHLLPPVDLLLTTADFHHQCAPSSPLTTAAFYVHEAHNTVALYLYVKSFKAHKYPSHQLLE
ncbi:hypothetical protein ATANTOWER_017027 [Ataeniobius toweri]|uniref:Uncharacterized protein n=1 Tax=Ataeniobius toweri TaxID=208326 RepID=A0ABU7AQP4_9TELE|nr:hypothetical protein [Ataeniobius toweri]